MKKKRDILVYLDDILESAKLIETYIASIIEGEFYKSLEKQDAVLHRLQIIGEAAKHVPTTNRKKWSHVPWKDIAGIRDIIVHEIAMIRKQQPEMRLNFIMAYSI